MVTTMEDRAFKKLYVILMTVVLLKRWIWWIIVMESAQLNTVQAIRYPLGGVPVCGPLTWRPTGCTADTTRFVAGETQPSPSRLADGRPGSGMAGAGGLDEGGSPQLRAPNGTRHGLRRRQTGG